MSKRPVIPTTLRIAGADWAVVKARLEGAFGQCDDDQKTITVDPDCCAILFHEVDTVIHEVMHAVLRQQGRLHTPEEELHVRALATGLAGVFRDNPALLRYLTKASA